MIDLINRYIMDKLANEKASTYMMDMKTNFKNVYSGKDIESLNGEEKQSLIYQLINYVENYPDMEFTASDLSKRTRVKNIVPKYDRCVAKIADGKQCTRKKRQGSELCGTHLKGTPHGKLDDVESSSKTKKVVVTAHDIKGIYYYLDDSGNVYHTSDVVQGKTNPRVVAKYTTDADGVIHIPDFNI